MSLRLPAALAAAFALVALLPAGAAAQTALPALGPLDQSGWLMGAVTAGEPGETWAYRQLPLDVPPPVFGGEALGFGPVSNPLRPDPQLAFLRYTDGDGWRVAQTPRDRTGGLWRGVIPNPAAARVLPRGGGFLIGRDGNAPPAEQAKLLVRDRGTVFTEVLAPPASILKAADTPNLGDPAESLTAERGLGEVAAGGYEADAGTRVFVAPQGRAVQDGILFYDGTGWAREPIVLPAAPAPVNFKVLAIDATAPDNAWFVAAVGLSDALVPPIVDPLGPEQPGIVLYRRVVGATGATWERQDLAAPLFSLAATPTRGVQELGALAGGPQQTLTVTASGLWIDGHMRAGTAPAQDFTLYFDIGARRVTRSWCDAVDAAGVGLCDAGLGFSFSRRTGYRSIAFAGDGFGRRIVSNPLDPGGEDTSNGGTYARFDGASFERVPAGNGNLRASAAFADPASGWLEGPVQVSAAAQPARLSRRPVSVRAPFTAVAGEPGRPPGAADASALAVGAAGAVARYVPGQGWVREFLLTSAGAVTSPTLRAVAWPEPTRAYAVGDLGAMWLWRRDTGLWERDAATPIGFEANLMGVAFEPGNAARGYAVGRTGTLLRYDKSWTPEALPPGLESVDLTSIAFSGSQAIVAAGADLLENEGGAWHIDQQARDLLSSVPGRPQLLAVAGLPDGGAVAAGRDIVIERDGPGAPWRFSDQPLPAATVIAVAAVRAGPRVSAIVSVVPRLQYPPAEDLPAPDPNVPPIILPPTPLPGDGYVLRELGSGWSDEQRTSFNGASSDRPMKSDPILAFDLDANGEGWAVGGWSGEADSAGRGTSARNAIGRVNRLRVQTAGIYRYSVGEGAAANAGAGVAPVTLDPATATFAVAGHAQCETPCALLAGQAIGPDRVLEAALARIGGLAARAGGPRLVLYTGGRNRATGSPQPGAEARRYASLISTAGGLPVYPAVSPGDSDGGSGAAPFRSAFAGFPAPFGDGAAPGGVAPLTSAGSGARTHYAFESAGAGGTVRVIVIDNSRGSLAASDPYQNPAEPQAPWLVDQLAAAKGAGVPAIVMGSRDLNSRFNPALNVAGDADAVAQILLAGGASAYFYDRPEENRSTPIPAGSAVTIPQFGTGTLGYRSPLSNTIAANQPDALFGDAGYLLAQVDTARRDAATNRAPVTARLVPIVDDLALQAVDGILLRRSRPSLFQGIGRKPLAGDRWGEVAGADGNPNPPGGDPYTAFPAALCTGPTCPSRLVPEYAFSSSDPDIADFVRQDPASTNLRKPFIGPGDKVVTDSRSGLLCPFNAGTTTVTISAGGLAFSQRVTVLAGSVQRPCGTRPLDPGRFTLATPAPVAAPPVAPAAAAAAPAVPPTPPQPVPAPKVVPPTPAPTVTPPAIPEPVIGPLNVTSTGVPGTPPPVNPGFARPIPPGGATVRAFEQKREEEVAPEQSQAFARYEPSHGFPIAPYLYGALILAAVAGVGARGGMRRRRRTAEVAVALSCVREPEPRHPRRRL